MAKVQIVQMKGDDGTNQYPKTRAKAVEMGAGKGTLEEKLLELEKKIGNASGEGAFYGFHLESSALPTNIKDSGFAYVGYDNHNLAVWNYVNGAWSDSGHKYDMYKGSGPLVNQNGQKPLQIWAGTRKEYDDLLIKDESIVYLIEGAERVPDVPVPSDPVEPVYDLKDELVLDGTNSLDTGIPLFDKDRNFTIFADFTPNPDNMKFLLNGYEKNIFFKVKIEEKPFIGIDISICTKGDDVTPQKRGELLTSSVQQGYYLGKMATGVPRNHRERLKFVIKRVAAEKRMYMYDSAGLIGSYADAGDVSANPFSETIELGFCKNGKVRHFAGTVHQFKVWYKNMQQSDINNLLK